MLGTLHNDLYFERMARSIGDKARLIDWLAPGPTLDVGAGDGALVAAIQQRTGDRAYGLDASQEAVDRSDRLVRLGTSPGIRTAFPETEFGNIVMSAVLHEIFSYNQPRGLRVCSMAVQEAAWALRLGGRLLIRDGVGPDDPDTLCRVLFADPAHGRTFHERWHQLSRTLGPGRPSARTWINRQDGHLYGHARDVVAFLFVYVWGDVSIEREAQEDYSCAGPLLTRASQLEAWTDLDLIHAESYQQPGYVQHWNQLCSLEEQAPDREDQWTERSWPMTNAIWILQKNQEPPVDQPDEDLDAHADQEKEHEPPDHH